VTQTDLREPPGRRGGCWPHDGEVAGCAVEIFVLANLVVPIAMELEPTAAQLSVVTTLS
jgi:hypothetical protein